MKIILFILGLGLTAHAQSKTSALSLQDYLEQVKTRNPEARAMREQLVKAENRLDEADIPLSSEFYAEYKIADDREEPVNPFMGTRKKMTGWKSGIRDKTQFGLGTDIFVQSDHNTLLGTSPAFPMMTDYHDSRGGIELTQSFWRNSFGSATRAELAAKRAGSRVELLKRQFDLKNLLLRAENAYWSMVSMNQIVRLQEDNVDRARKLRDWMRRRVGLRLVDDVDGLQAQAALETRELELQTSLDERAASARQFNTLRGMYSDEVSSLVDLPAAEILLKTSKDLKQKMSREDFRMVYEQAEISAAEARGARSQIAPQLDVRAGLYTNGLDRDRGRSQQEVEDLRNPAWAVGVVFSVPLDYSLISNMRKSYAAADRAAAASKEFAKFNEERAWSDIQSQKNESQKRFERAISLERLQTDLVKRERQRLMNGRTTTFQALQIEQNLALAQIQRVRSQLGLLQLNNVLKTWEGQP